MNKKIIIATVGMVWLMIGGVIFSIHDDSTPQSFKVSSQTHTFSIAPTPSINKHQANTPTSATEQMPVNATNSLVIPMMSSEEERLTTLAQRKQGLPIFLKVAEQSITEQQQKIAEAKKNGTNASDLAALENRLAQMQQAKLQVLARNQDIVEETAKL